jgi:hypothetical protein
MIFNILKIHIISPQTHQKIQTTTGQTPPIHHSSIHQSTNPPNQTQKCPKEVQDATTTTAPNATVADADGSTYSSVTVQLTPTNVLSTTCLTRHTRLVVCVMVRTMLLRERGEINRSVTEIIPLMSVKVRKEMGRGKKARKEKARKVKAKRRSNQPRPLLTFLLNHNCLIFLLINSTSYKSDC